MSRTKMTVRNLTAGCIITAWNMILGLVARTVFISILGTDYLGINGLYTGILGVLSFTELGFGTVVNYSLYKPVADNDIEKIKSLMKFYKKIYHIIAGSVGLLGVMLIPFLPLLVKGGEYIGSANLRIYYIIFLLNTVLSYFVSYKYSLVNAEQKNYITTIIEGIVTTSMHLAQICILFLLKNYLFYLLSTSVIYIIRSVIVDYTITRMYPYLRDTAVSPISREDFSEIKKNVNAIVWHKFGEVAIHQTDNIIISIGINIGAVGLVSNYMAIVNMVNAFVSTVFLSTLSSIGNLVASSEKAHNKVVFKRLSSLSTWCYGFFSTMLFLFLSKIITVWIGADKTIDSLSVGLICLNYYFQGQRIVLFNFETGYGRFVNVKYVPLLAGIVNIIISVMGAFIFGLPGIYIGTLVSGLFQSIVRAFISYEKMFEQKVTVYFKELFLGALFWCIAVSICFWVNGFLFKKMTIVLIIAEMFLDAVILIVLCIFVFYKRDEFKFYCRFIKDTIKKLMKK